MHGSFGDNLYSCIFYHGVTTAKTDSEALFLLEKFGMPFTS
jgi:hypothetical protein